MKITREQMHALLILMEFHIDTVESGDYGYGGEWFPHTETDLDSIPVALNAVLAFLDDPVIDERWGVPNFRKQVDKAIDDEDWLISMYPPDGVYRPIGP